MKKIIYIFIFSLVLFIPEVFACDKEELIKDNYEYLTGIYPEFVLEEKTCEQIQTIIDNNYVLRKTVVSDDMPEYSPNISGHFSTSYKTVTLHFYDGEGGGNLVTLDNEWKKLPAFRGNDILALRFTGPAYYSGSCESYFQYSTSTTSYRTTSTASSDNATVRSNGIGFVYKLPTGDLESLYAYMDVMSTGSGTIAGTYQHATKGVSLANAKNYTISAAGLGGVIYHSSTTVRGSYDQMTGASISV